MSARRKAKRAVPRVVGEFIRARLVWEEVYAATPHSKLREREWKRLVKLGFDAHPELRGTVAQVIEAAETAGRTMVLAVIGKAWREVPEWIGSHNVNLLVECTLPVENIRRLRSIYKMETGVFRGRLEEMDALFRLHEEFQRVVFLAAELECQAKDTDLFIYHAFQRAADELFSEKKQPEDRPATW